MRVKFRPFVALIAACLICMAGSAAAAPFKDGSNEKIKCANLIYGGSKSSVCFSGKFLSTVAKETNCDPDTKFTPVKTASDTLFKYPFAIMTGEGTFSLTVAERKNLKSYLMRGGFLLASAGCSSKPWNVAFRKEIRKIFPDRKLKKIPMDHPIFDTVYKIKSIKLKEGGSASLEGLEIDGKIVLVYSQEGLNDTGNVKGCCCCGGNEIKNCREINVNVLMYAVTH